MPGQISRLPGYAIPVAALHISVDLHNSVELLVFTKNAEIKRLLKRHGCTFETHKGGSGHITVRLGDKTSQLPVHGGRKEPETGLVNKIRKDLGLK